MADPCWKREDDSLTAWGDASCSGTKEWTPSQLSDSRACFAIACYMVACWEPEIPPWSAHQDGAAVCQEPVVPPPVDVRAFSAGFDEGFS